VTNAAKKTVEDYQCQTIERLNRYQEVAVTIEMLNLDLEMLEQALANDTAYNNNMAVDYATVSGGKTNKVNSMVESEFMAVRANIQRLRRQIWELERHNRQIDKALANMPLIYARLLNMRYIKKLGWKEIGQRLGNYNEDHLRKNLHDKALKMLTGYLFPEVHNIGLFLKKAQD